MGLHNVGTFGVYDFAICTQFSEFKFCIFGLGNLGTYGFGNLNTCGLGKLGTCNGHNLAAFASGDVVTFGLHKYMY